MLQITPSLDGGGVERVTLETARAVVSAGGRSLVASAGGRLESLLVAEGSELVRLPADRRDPLSLALNAGRLARVMRERSVSVAHVRSRAPAFSALAAARRTGTPILATYHGVYSANGRLKRWYNSVMTRGDLTIANSNFTRDHILAEHRVDPGRVLVIPEGIDTETFDPARVDPAAADLFRDRWGGASGGPILLLAARLTGWKGHGVMIDALARLDDHPRARLILAGAERNPGDAARLLARAAELGLSDRVLWVGALTDMAHAYAAADVVVAPSILAESFGRSVVEAMAMARPVIASPLGGPAETVVDGETGWLAAAGDPAAWAAKLRHVVCLDAARRAAIGEAARTRVVTHYALTTMMTETFAVYRRLAAAR